MAARRDLQGVQGLAFITLKFRVGLRRCSGAMNLPLSQIQKLKDWFDGRTFLIRFQLIFWCIYAVASFPIHYAGMRYVIEWTASFGGIALFKFVDYIYGFFMTTGMGMIYDRPAVRRLSRIKTVIFLCLLSVLMLLIDWFVFRPAFIFPLAEIIGDSPANPEKRMIIRGIIFVWFFVMYAGWSTIYLLTRSSAESAAQKDKLREEQIRRHAAELGMLRSQVNPHFLFNAMNTIASESDGNRQIDRVVSGLSDYFRYSLASANRVLVPFEEELHATLQYLQVERARFGDALAISVDVDDASRQLNLPGIILQPLVENAVKHGRETSPLPLKIDIAARCVKDLLEIRVRNSGLWRERRSSPEVPSGFGLANLRERLVLLYGTGTEVVIEAGESDVTVVVRINEPMRRILTDS